MDPHQHEQPIGEGQLPGFPLFRTFALDAGDGGSGSGGAALLACLEGSPPAGGGEHATL
jgi:hypothetical protein